MARMRSGRNARRPSNARTINLLMDWTRRLMQLAAVATVVLYGYLLVGLLFGNVGQWASLSAPGEQARVVGNVRGAVLWATVALGVLVATLCVIFYDEESLGYTLVALALFGYFGVPFLFDTALNGQVEGWTKAGHPAFLIREQFRVAAFILIVPGVLLSIRELGRSFREHASRSGQDRSAMVYGADAREESEPPGALVGAFAKCWQLPFCWSALRDACPIFLKKTRCWRERVGCMCEEHVIRTVMDRYAREAPPEQVDPNRIDLTAELDGPKPPAPAPKAVVTTKVVPPSEVKIPQNPHIPMAVKVQRCRNCVIYNEHQRLKYQLYAPLVILAVPALAIWQSPLIYGWLKRLLEVVDRTVAHINPLQTNVPAGVTSDILGSSGIAAQYVLLGSLVVLATSVALRWLEWAVFAKKV